MVSNRMSKVTIFDHNHFKQKIHQYNLIALNIGSYFIKNLFIIFEQNGSCDKRIVNIFVSVQSRTRLLL